jgi:hypothetical protein
MNKCTYMKKHVQMCIHVPYMDINMKIDMEKEWDLTGT